MSADLIWELTRPWNCAHMRRTHPVKLLTTEKGSLSGRRTFVDSGYSNAKAVDVAIDDGSVILSFKNDAEADARKPDKLWTSSTLSTGARAALSKTEAKVGAYRPAATEIALKKVSAAVRAEQRSAAGVDHTSVKKGRSSRK